MLVLLVAGGDDFVALAIGGSVVEIRTILRILVLAAPPCAAALTYFICAWTEEAEGCSRGASADTASSATGSRQISSTGDTGPAAAATVTQSLQYPTGNP